MSKPQERGIDQRDRPDKGRDAGWMPSRLNMFEADHGCPAATSEVGAQRRHLTVVASSGSEVPMATSVRADPPCPADPP